MAEKRCFDFYADPDSQFGVGWKHEYTGPGTPQRYCRDVGPEFAQALADAERKVGERIARRWGSTADGGNGVDQAHRIVGAWVVSERDAEAAKRCCIDIDLAWMAPLLSIVAQGTITQALKGWELRGTGVDGFTLRYCRDEAVADVLAEAQRIVGAQLAKGPGPSEGVSSLPNETPTDAANRILGQWAVTPVDEPPEA